MGRCALLALSGLFAGIMQQVATQSVVEGVTDAATNAAGAVASIAGAAGDAAKTVIEVANNTLVNVPSLPNLPSLPEVLNNTLANLPAIPTLPPLSEVMNSTLANLPAIPSLPPLAEVVNHTLANLPAIPTLPPLAEVLNNTLANLPAMPTLPPLPTLPALPVEASPPENCTVTGYYYSPQYMNLSPKTVAVSWQSCMARCQLEPKCEHFSFWPDGGCMTQPIDAVTLVKASSACPADDTKECAGSRVISGPKNCIEGWYPDLSKAVDSPPLEPECNETGVYYEGGRETQTIQASRELCQLLCYNTPTCATYSFWPQDGHCLLQEANATKISAAVECEQAATGAVNASACIGKNVISGPRECPAPPGHECTVTGHFYKNPYGDLVLNFVASFEDCQKLCLADPFNCKKVSYWPDDQVCAKQEAGADLSTWDPKDLCENPALLQNWSWTPRQTNSTGCHFLNVQSGPASCGAGFYHLYPSRGAVADAVPQPPSPSPSPVPPVVVHDNDVQVTTKEQAGFPWGWAILVLVIVAALAAAAMYGCGFFDGDTKKDKKRLSKKKTSGSTSKKGNESSERQKLIQADAHAQEAPPVVETHIQQQQVNMYQQMPPGMPQVQAQYQQQIAYGQVSPQHYRGGQFAGAVAMGQQDLFNMLDRNHDGMLSREEYAAGATACQLQQRR